MNQKYDELMVRRNHFIPVHQDNAMKKIHKKTGVKPSETIRRAIDHYIKTFHPKIYKEG